MLSQRNDISTEISSSRTNKLKYGDKIRLKAISPYMMPPYVQSQSQLVVAGFVGIMQKHSLYALGPGAENFTDAVFTVRPGVSAAERKRAKEELDNKLRANRSCSEILLQTRMPTHRPRAPTAAAGSAVSDAKTFVTGSVQIPRSKEAERTDAHAKRMAQARTYAGPPPSDPKRNHTKERSSSPTTRERKRDKLRSNLNDRMQKAEELLSKTRELFNLVKENISGEVSDGLDAKEFDRSAVNYGDPVILVDQFGKTFKISIQTWFNGYLGSAVATDDCPVTLSPNPALREELEGKAICYGDNKIRIVNPKYKNLEFKVYRSEKSSQKGGYLMCTEDAMPSIDFEIVEATDTNPSSNPRYTGPSIVSCSTTIFPGFEDSQPGLGSMSVRSTITPSVSAINQSVFRAVEITVGSMKRVPPPIPLSQRGDSRRASGVEQQVLPPPTASPSSLSSGEEPILSILDDNQLDTKGNALEAADSKKEQEKDTAPVKSVEETNRDRIIAEAQDQLR